MLLKSRPRKAFRMTLKANGIWYFKPLNGKWRSSGSKNRAEAEIFAVEHCGDLRAHHTFLKDHLTLKQYLAPYYTPACPHAARLRTEGKSIGDLHLRNSRRLLEKKLFTDPVAEYLMSSLRRGDLLDYRERLRAHYGPRTVNRVMQCLKTSIREGIYREELSRDPSQGIGNITYQINTSGVFTEAEVRQMFSFTRCPRPWADDETYTAFLLMYTCGMRKGEILGLRWKNVDFDNNMIHVTEALSEGRKLQKPKWGKLRNVPLPEATKTALQAYQKGREHVFGLDFVFCDALGQPHAAGWALTRFRSAMKTLNIDLAARHLRIHSLRHSAHTHLVASGYSTTLARAAFGWSSEQVQRGYLHLSGEDLRGQAQVFDNLLGR